MIINEIIIESRDIYKIDNFFLYVKKRLINKNIKVYRYVRVKILELKHPYIFSIILR